LRTISVFFGKNRFKFGFVAQIDGSSQGMCTKTKTKTHSLIALLMRLCFFKLCAYSCVSSLLQRILT